MIMYDKLYRHIESVCWGTNFSVFGLCQLYGIPKRTLLKIVADIYGDFVWHHSAYDEIVVTTYRPEASASGSWHNLRKRGSIRKLRVALRLRNERRKYGR